MKSISVKLEDRSYPIHVGRGILRQSGKTLKRLNLSKQLVIVSNPIVLELYGTILHRSLIGAGFEVVMFHIPAGERYKTLGTVEKIYHQLTRLRVNRKSTLIAFGGGVVGDAVGFAAATYLRGIGCVQIPTTLLAQIDSAIGGKTGVNLINGKNLVGAFHQPLAVIADPSLLGSLVTREFHSGLYEAIKYGIIRSRNLFDLIVGKHSQFLRKEKRSLESVIAQCAAIKAAVVAADERESGLRMILNFGHTFGHALEAATGYRLLTHGEAIGHGMIMACQLSEVLGMIDPVDSKRIIGPIRQISVLPSLRSIRPRTIIHHMFSDKKIVEHRLRFVLPVRIGKVEIVSDIPISTVDRVLRSYFDAQP